MNVLLDTHTLLWFLDDSPRLSSTAKATIEDDDNVKYVSVATLWETAIKVSVGKLTLSVPYEEFVTRQLARNGFEVLHISVDHLTLISGLPFHHRDPFDRMLAAQSLSENMPLVSADAVFDLYGVNRLY